MTFQSNYSTIKPTFQYKIIDKILTFQYKNPYKNLTFQIFIGIYYFYSVCKIKY